MPEKFANATRSIPTLFNFLSVAVIDLVIKVSLRVRCRPHHKHLVTTYTQPSIRNPAQLLAAQTDILVDGIEDHKIIAEPVHFCKL